MGCGYEEGRLTGGASARSRYVGKRGAGSSGCELVLSDDAVQESFETDKYKCLAYDWPNRGARFREKVEEEWPEFVSEVAGAPWRRNFSRAPELYSDPLALADALYTSAVWGFGVVGWVDGNGPLECILGLQKLKAPNRYRTYLWDTPIFLGTGMYIPSEFGTLDRFLQKVWVGLIL